VLEGWYTDSACRNRFDFSTPVTERLTLYANWVKVEPPRATPING
jgi:uncharacterized repeat protein (TIGR02543 family)